MSSAELGRLMADWAGIEMTRGGIDHSVQQYVQRRSRELGITVEQYLPLLSGPQCAEFLALVDATTVTYTWFLRDSAQLSAIAQLLQDLPAHGRPLQVWVAGCATGEDVYSIALLANELARPIEILGTDLNSRALAVARGGRYGAFSVRDLTPRYATSFTPVGAGQWLVAPALRKNVRFAFGNLVEPPPMPASGGGWDLILCRNVLIYFVRAQAHRVFEALSGSLRSGGYLMVGSSEIVFDVPTELEPVYVGERLAFRRSGQSTTAGGKERLNRQSLVPSAAKDRWIGPLPALPSSAAELVQPAQRNADLTAAHSSAARTGELARAHTLLDAGELAAALEIYLSLVAREPSDAEAHTYTGITYYLQSDIERATHELRAALLLDALSWVATFYLALCYETSGLLDAAVREYRRVVSLAEGQPRQATSVERLRPWHAELLKLARVRARVA